MTFQPTLINFPSQVNCCQWKIKIGFQSLCCHRFSFQWGFTVQPHTRKFSIVRLPQNCTKLPKWPAKKQSGQVWARGKFIREKKKSSFLRVSFFSFLNINNDRLGVHCAALETTIFQLCGCTCADSYKKTSPNTAAIVNGFVAARWSTSICVLLRSCEFLNYLRFAFWFSLWLR